METVAPLEEFTDLVKEKSGKTFEFCYLCGTCNVVWPWNRVRRFSTSKIVRQATLGLTEIASEDTRRCTTRGSFPQRCPRGANRNELGVSLRRIATEYGFIPEISPPRSACNECFNLRPTSALQAAFVLMRSLTSFPASFKPANGDEARK